MAVERLRYFTGLFLEEPEFTLEQVYHLAMRRRLNYALFDSGVLFGLDVTKEAVDRVRVDPGMAVDRSDLATQGREIVLTAARQVSLAGFAAGANVFIALSYGEQPAVPKPPLNIESRTSEEPLIQAVLDSGGGFTLDQNLNVALARVRVGDLSVPDVVPPNRRIAQLRMAGGTGPGTGTPTVTSLAFSAPPQQGSTPVMTITGTNLGNNPQVSVLTLLSTPDAQITAAINAGLSNDTTLVVNLTIGAGAALGDRLVRVATDIGTVTTASAGATAFTVLPPGPTVATINPTGGRQTVNVPVTITGTNLGGATVTVRQNDTSLDPNITVSGVVVNGAGTSITATLNIGAAAVPGGRRIRAVTAGGTVDSVVDLFTVRAAPVIKSILPASQLANNPISVRGSDIRDPGLNAGDSAAATTSVRFVNPGNAADFVAAATITVQSNIAVATGPQRVEVIVPPKSVTMPNAVNLVLTIENAQTVFAFTYL
jgi:hypothetical protein